MIPGNATSAVGAAAFAKTVANDLDKAVAAIVTGQGGLDRTFETLSGGLFMAPVAKMLHALFELLKDQMIEQTETGLTFRAPDDRRLKMIIGHSKGNWAILTALLDFELNVIGSRNPDEYLYVGCEHALKEGEGESGLPLNAILKAIY